MKKTVCISLLVMVMVLAFGMTVVGCEKPDETKESDSGTSTLTGIPAKYNGKYVHFYAEVHDHLNVCNYQGGIITEPDDLEIWTKISGGSVTLPMWNLNSWCRYEGSDICEQVLVYISEDRSEGDIIDGRIYKQVKFTNGNATVTWAQGTELEGPEIGEGENTGEDSNG